MIGTIPHLESSNLQVLLFRANSLTGSIPTELGRLKDLRIMALNHNSIKGKIPSEFKELKKLEFLQLHQNQLTGIAPLIDRMRLTGDLNAFIADCGKKSPLQCDSCTMCCDKNDPEEKCQGKWDWKPSILFWALMIPLILSSFPAIIIFIAVMLFKSSPTSSWFDDTRDVLSIYAPDSVYSFIFAMEKRGVWVHIATASIQMWLFLAFVLASDSNNANSDWEFNINALLQADRKYDLETGLNYGDGFDAFHANGVDYIGPDGTSVSDYPNTDLYQSGRVKRTGHVIYRISISTDSMTFRFIHDKDEGKNGGATK